jgi:hypothetical protein
MAEDLLKKYTFAVDSIKASANGKPMTIAFSQGDVKTAILIINLTENDTALDLTGKKVRVSFKKSDGTSVMQDMTTGISFLDAAAGKIQIQLSTQALSARGNVRGQISISDEVAGLVAETAEFTFVVRESIVNTSIISTDELPIIEQTIEAAKVLESVDLQTIVNNTSNVTSLKSEVETARGASANLAGRFSSVESSLAQKAAQTDFNTHKTDYKKHKYVVTDFGVVMSDSSKAQANTDALNALISGLTDGTTIYFPLGTCYTNGFTISKLVNIQGESEYNSKIYNMSANPCITINPNIERGKISNICISGNNVDSGDGILLNGCYVWTFEHCWIKDNAHGINAKQTSGVYNLYISDCRVESNRLDGINCIADSYNYQKNVIIVRNSNVSDNDRHGFNLWATNFIIDACCIQGNKQVGIFLSSDMPTATVSIHSGKIKDNYFELNKGGHIYVKAQYIASPLKTNDITHLVIENNYGFLNASQVNAGVTALVKVETPNVTIDSPRIFNLEYQNNNFSSDTLKQADFSDVLGSDSTITWANGKLDPSNLIVGMGAAKFNGLNQKVISGHMFAKGVAYTQKEKSDNIPAGITNIYFPTFLNLYETVRKIGVYCNTDATDYLVAFYVVKKDVKGVATYTNLFVSGGGSKSGSQFLESSWSSAVSSSKLVPTGEDTLLQIRVTINTAGTYFYLGNPIITYS